MPGRLWSSILANQEPLFPWRDCVIIADFAGNDRDRFLDDCNFNMLCNLAYMVAMAFSNCDTVSDVVEEELCQA